MAERKASLNFSFGSTAKAVAFQKALAPETEDIPDTKTIISRQGAEVKIEIETPDTPALRAGVKSYIQWASCVIGMQKIAANPEKTLKE
ncbi:MAG: KEOPS complex subunit Pcc1 [Candidatus Thermoplasmatota archaeon]|nr:KEOPS complex subunit Pcc1 [Candidatus Thermoplasmatota archaeon]